MKKSLLMPLLFVLSIPAAAADSFQTGRAAFQTASLAFDDTAMGDYLCSSYNLDNELFHDEALRLNVAKVGGQWVLHSRDEGEPEAVDISADAQQLVVNDDDGDRLVIFRRVSADLIACEDSESPQIIRAAGNTPAPEASTPGFTAQSYALCRKQL